MNSPELQPVAAVCDNEVRIYGAVNGNGVRPLQRVIKFPHRGAALLWAYDHDEDSTPKPQRKH